MIINLTKCAIFNESSERNDEIMLHEHPNREECKNEQEIIYCITISNRYNRFC